MIKKLNNYYRNKQECFFLYKNSLKMKFIIIITDLLCFLSCKNNKTTPDNKETSNASKI